MPQTFMEAAARFEQSTIDQLKFSNKVAWTVALSACGGMVLALGIAFVVTFLHKDPDPVILARDNITGATTVLRALKDSLDKYDEVTDSYYLAMYVRDRESYDWFSIGDMSEAVKLMSAPEIGSEYDKTLQAKNSPLNLLKDKFRIKAKVGSIVFTGELAQVRFTTEKLSVSGDNNDGSPVQNWIATIAYKYESGRMTQQQRLVNPLGLKVLNYRVDPEVLK